MFAEWASGIHITPDRETVEKYINAMVEVSFNLSLSPTEIWIRFDTVYSLVQPLGVCVFRARSIPQHF